MRIFFFVMLPVFCLFFGGHRDLFGQETGFQYIRNYSPGEYDHKPQNWSIVQDGQGVIYVGNQGGLLQYDGVSWRLLLIRNWNVRSLAIDGETGTVYIGGNNEIGYLAPNSSGSLKYISLREQIKEHQRKFSIVWETHSTGEGIYFQSSEYLFRWNDEQLKGWGPRNGFNAAFSCGGKLVIRRAKIGLMEMAKDDLTPLPGGNTFADKSIFMMTRYQPGMQKLLIGTPDGFYIYNGINAEPFFTEADDYLRENGLYTGTRLSSGDFAMATVRGGIVVIDSRGRLKHIFNKTRGLRDDNVRCIFEDFQGNLWLGLDSGISKIEYTSPLSILDDRSNLPRGIQTVTRHGPHGVLYAGTTRGLYYFAPSHRLDRPGEFHLATEMPRECWSLLSIENSLLVATERGVFQLDTQNNTKRKIIENHSYVLLRSRKEPRRIWVGTHNGLCALYLRNQNGNRRWTAEHRFRNIDEEIRTIVEDEYGDLWLGTLTRGVLKVNFLSGESIDAPGVHRYDTSRGSCRLPAGQVHVFWAAEHTMFATEKGIYRFDRGRKVFIPDTTLGPEFAGNPDGKSVYRIVEDGNKNIWLHSRLRNIQAIRRPDGTFLLHKKTFLRLPKVQVEVIYPDPGGNITWFGGEEGLIRCDTRIKKNYRHDFATLIRRVVVNGKPIFGGYKSGIDNVPQAKQPIAYKDRNIRFEFAAPFFENESATQYRCSLEGYQNDWSEWSPETWRDYTNLDPGLYHFRVQARNVYLHEGKEAVFKFKVLPPWFKTWWAFSFYATALFLVMFFIVRWRSGKLKREKVKLEQIIMVRTKEINEKNRQLEKQTLQLKDQSEKLKEMDRVKSRFFTNISHEFRTPLTLIMGPLEQLLVKIRGSEHRKTLNLMLRNSHRLLGLINQLLELSRFDSGKVKLEASRQNIVPFLKGIAAAFEPVMAKNELDFSIDTHGENITLYFDPQKLEEVIYNLLSNAVKFTPPGGKITVTVTQSHEDEENSTGVSYISVCDTGPGIPRDQLVNVFDRFYQLDSTVDHHRKGSGIGLAIAKELVELHHGKIDAHSTEGKGSEFIIRLPMGKEHLKPDEIVPTDVKPGIPADVKPGIPTDVKPGIPTDVKPGVPADVKPGVPADVIPGIPAWIEDEIADNRETDQRASEKDAASLEPGVSAKDIILVVEDSSDVREYIRGALEPSYKVMEAADGEDGIQKAREFIPDLIISDIMMPKKDGNELCRTLKNDIKTSHIPIILLTARASEENIIEGLETGADDYVTKPFNTAILCARIKNLIDLRGQMQQTFSREMTLQPVKIPVSRIDRKFIKALKEVIKENVSDPDFNIDQMCKKMDMSQPTLYRKIHALTGESPTEFIRSYRLKRGAELLKNNFGTVVEVAFEVGFSSANYFTKCFKKKFHILPTTYKETSA